MRSGHRRGERRRGARRREAKPEVRATRSLSTRRGRDEERQYEACSWAGSPSVRSARGRFWCHHGQKRKVREREFVFNIILIDIYVYKGIQDLFSYDFECRAAFVTVRRDVVPSFARGGNEVRHDERVEIARISECRWRKGGVR